MQAMRSELPSGTVTFLFTDVEGSTALLHELGAEGYGSALLEHRRVVREAFATHGGVEVDTQGDAFFVAFPTAPGALAAAKDILHGLTGGRVTVRVGIHTGRPHLTSDGYVGRDVNLGARIAAAGHGGQALLSKETKELVDANTTDLGEHRLKDFDEAVWIFQLGTDRFPPLKTISNTNLPRPASSFVGRAREVSDVASLIRKGTRLLTLTGPGGSGKTRLAIEATTELLPEYKNGVFWVGLASLHDPALVVETIAQTLGAKNGLAEHVREREMLLLLDNLEQVVEAAPELVALLESCPNAKLLVTSRERLRVRGEVEYPVPPLAQAEALELFCERSQLEPDTTIAEVCCRLDNLPLAVELAAARTSVLSPRQILERLAKRLDLLRGGRDAEARQRTLRATIAWSHELLDEPEQGLFARLAVFSGGCTIESAEQVADADLDVLQSLVEKSLVRRTDERFWMLQTIREYAAEALEESGEADALRRRHAKHYLAIGEKAMAAMSRSYSGEWLERLEREHDNLRAALDHLEVIGEGELVLRLAGALVDFWYYAGHVAEGRRRLESALRVGGTSITAARAWALLGAAFMAYGSGDVSTAKSHATESLALQRRFAEPSRTALALNILVGAAIEEGDFESAEELAEESLELVREAGEDELVVAATNTLAFVYYNRGDLEGARALHEANLQRARKLGLKDYEAGTLGSLSIIAADECRAEEALHLVKESVSVARSLGSLQDIAQSLCRAADLLVRFHGNADAAARLLSCFEGLRERIGVSLTWVARKNEQTLAEIRRQLDEASFEEAFELGRKLTAEEAAELALTALAQRG
jgi:predicted ATPase/class 3 adenylate cyclase